MNDETKIPRLGPPIAGELGAEASLAADGIRRRSVAMPGSVGLRPKIRFGDFEFAPAQRRLERAGVGVELSSRALDILAALTERPGQVVSKQDLLARVWPQSTVVEGALRVYMVALRRALGDGEGDGGRRFITTVPGQGYCFVGQIEGAAIAPEDAAGPLEAPPRLPARPSKVVGRDSIVAAVLLQMAAQRFVTLVGPGGIGKTTVALLAAHDWVAVHGGAAVYVDLSEVDPDGGESVAEALCDKLGLAGQAVPPTDAAIAHLRANPTLLVLDTCEGVIEAAVRFVEAVVASAPGVRVLATSRESLRAEGEAVYRIQPLAAPRAEDALTAQAALAYPAVQLFVQRATANDLSFELSDAQAAVAGGICRELDGIALAIELAASRVDAFGIQQVADLLATEFALTWPGRRTAAPRQQTLRATLHWSYELLAPVERIVLRRLAALAGAYPLEAAVAVGADEAGLGAAEVAAALSSLVAKSLLNVVVDSAANRFRMLDTTRSFALTKLAESEDEPTTRRRQAGYCLGRLAEMEAGQNTAEMTAEVVANVTATLSWAFGPDGDPATGRRLSSAAAGFWVRHGLLAECRRWALVVQARAASDPSPDDLGAQLTFANALMVTDGIGDRQRRELEIAYAQTLRQGQLDERVSGLFVLWADHHRRCQYAAADKLVEEADFLEPPEATHAHRLIALWVRGVTDHCAGRQARACEHLNRLLSDYTEDAGRHFLRRFGYDLEAAAATILGMSEFLRGNLEKAFAANDRGLAKGRTLSSPVSLRAVLRWRATMMYFVDEEGIEIEHLTRDILPPEAFGYADNRPEGTAQAIHGLWLARNGDCARGAELCRQGLKACRESDYLTIQSLVRAEIALQLLRHGAGDQIDEFVAPLEHEAEEDGWSTPEVLRIRGEIAERRGDLELAEVRYRAALALAERQGALTWRLRATVSLADLRRAQGHGSEAAAMLAPVFGQVRADIAWPLMQRASAVFAASRRVAAEL